MAISIVTGTMENFEYIIICLFELAGNIIYFLYHLQFLILRTLTEFRALI